MGDSVVITTPLREHHPFRGYDIFPGGKIDPQDVPDGQPFNPHDSVTRLRSARREVVEETGGKLIIGPLRCTGKLIVTGRIPGARTIVWLYWAEAEPVSQLSWLIHHDDECVTRAVPLRYLAELKFPEGDILWFPMALIGLPIRVRIHYHGKNMAFCSVSVGD